MQKNLTLSIDEDLLRAARKRALDYDTTVNEMVRKFLANYVQKKDFDTASSATLREFFSKHSVEIGKITWTREELHERS